MWNLLSFLQLEGSAHAPWGRGFTWQTLLTHPSSASYHPASETVTSCKAGADRAPLLQRRVAHYLTYGTLEQKCLLIP